MNSPLDQFRDALRARGIIPPAQIVAGVMQRADVDANHGKGDASYIYFADGIPAGGFENHRDGRGWENWRADIGRQLSFAEHEGHQQRIEAARRQREAEQDQERAAARESAASRWASAGSADPEHPYLIRKGIEPHGIRQAGDLLLIPVRDGTDLHSLQTINAGGDKRFLTGGRVAGCYYGIGKPNGVICVAEGFATGATIHEATGHAVAVAFNAGNLEAVARTLRARLPDATIIVCADDDYRTDGNPGILNATKAAAAVRGLLAVPDFGPERPEGATDFNDLAIHRGREAVRQAMAAASAPPVPAPQQPADRASDAVLDSRIWPAAMDAAALHGIAGEFVGMVAPNTEADPAAVLMQFLVAFGALVGRGPHFRVEGDEHHPNLFVILVGATAKGRKGTSWGRVREVFERIPDWKPHMSGLSSGEGVKYHVRDAREETKTTKGESVTEIVDEGVADKRLFVVESEFASALRNAQKPGNTLSATIRESWDSGTLRTLTKHDPVTATGAHICIVGHITADELRAELTATDSANGFANRFLFVAVKRSQLLPFGGEDADRAEVQAFADRLRDRATMARTRGRILMTPAARAVWATVYPELSGGADGLHGAVTARAEAQVIRLALIYCLLDGGGEIDAAHLLAGIAVWQYCDATAKYVFGASLGDRNADEIARRLEHAGDAGLSRTEIRDHFKRHVPAERIGAALELLRARGRATCEIVDTGGKPKEVWRIAA